MLDGGILHCWAWSYKDTFSEDDDTHTEEPFRRKNGVRKKSGSKRQREKIFKKSMLRHF